MHYVTLVTTTYFKLSYSLTNCYNNVGIVWWYKFDTTDVIIDVCVPHSDMMRINSWLYKKYWTWNMTFTSFYIVFLYWLKVNLVLHFIFISNNNIGTNTLPNSFQFNVIELVINFIYISVVPYSRLWHGHIVISSCNKVVL